LRGAKENNKKSMKESHAEGKIEVWLEGKKIRGGYALIKTSKGKDERWLLIKMKDEKADARRNPISTEPMSAITNRTLEQIAQRKNSKGTKK